MKKLYSIVFGVGVAACHANGQSEVKPPVNEVWLGKAQIDSARLVIAPVTEQPVGGTVSASGRITFDDLRVSHVFSPVTGRVIKIEAQPGQRVKKGATLATIESPDVGSAFSDLSKAQADAIAAEHEFQREKDLFADHAASQKDLEVAEDAFRRSRAELERARQKARLFRADSVDRVSQAYTLHALIDGEVVARAISPGEEVQGLYSGGNAKELFTIGELGRVWVLADVFEMDLAKVKVGAQVMVHTVAYPNKIFEGTVDWVSGSLDPSTRAAKIRCAIANAEHELKPEMYATVSIATDQRKALAIPRTAVLRLGDTTVVFVHVGQTPQGKWRFERRPVAVNEDEGDHYLPVIQGLRSGEQVVTTGAILLSGML